MNIVPAMRVRSQQPIIKTKHTSDITVVISTKNCVKALHSFVSQIQTHPTWGDGYKLAFANVLRKFESWSNNSARTLYLNANILLEKLNWKRDSISGYKFSVVNTVMMLFYNINQNCTYSLDDVVKLYAAEISYFIL